MDETLLALSSERPISGLEHDRLNLGVVAEALATAIRRQPTGDAFVIGVEGKWGSGKSSVLGLMLSRFRGVNDRPDILGSSVPIIVEFRPWLIGNREGLLTELFSELTAAIDRTYKEDRTAVEQVQAAARELTKALPRYATAASLVSAAAPGAALITGWHFLTPVAQAAVAVTKPRSKPLSETKTKVVDLLRKLDRRVIITIDDLDRLEPSEAVEVLRLTKAVADFPNLVYIACFDRKILSEAISGKLGLSDGDAFLEKIFQAVIALPVPQSFDLRRWLTDEIKAVAFSSSSDAMANQPAIDRLEAIVSAEGERRLHTPRDVIRVMNLFKLYWPPVRSRVDVADMAWLMMLKIKSPDLHAWVMEYVEEISQSQLGARTSDPLKRHFTKRLDEILNRDGWSRDAAYRTLSEIFPSIQATRLNNDGQHEFSLFQEPSEERQLIFDQDNRLASPVSGRLYFAFDTLKGSLDRDRLEEALKAFADRPAGVALLTDWGSEVRPQGGTMAELLIETLANRPNIVSPADVRTVCLTLADVMDDLERDRPPGEFGRRAVWSSARRLFDRLRGASHVTASSTLEKMFEEGRALGWLSEIIRTQYFSSLRNPSDSNLYINSTNQETIHNIFIDRCKSSGAALLHVPSLLTLLWAWKETGGELEARAWCASYTQAPEDLIVLLGKMRSWRSTNDRVEFPIRRQEVEPFIDYDAVRKRIELVATGNDTLAARAKDLKHAFDQGDEEPRT